MKVMLRKDSDGDLTAYVAKKDLEEKVVDETVNDNAKILTLANGWELAIALEEPQKLPTTIEAKKL
ncbi:MAG: putative nitrogen fixation protein NifT [Okeania sp. SIO2H7]|nr:putative nitrogen fixation protein NifT [Okeania sp. SIO2H7]